jgi:rare lipoprotein A
MLSVLLAGLLMLAPRHARADQADEAPVPRDVTADGGDGIRADFATDVASRPQLDASGDWTGETGVASYYSGAHQGKRMAGGGRFNQMALTAAHPWLPFGTKVLVTVRQTGRAVVVTITDRLPSGRRAIDVSLAAARALGFASQGLAQVTLASFSPVAFR